MLSQSDNSKKITLTPKIKELQLIYKKTKATLQALEQEQDQLIKDFSKKK